MKYTGPKAKLCRRQGTNLFGSDKYDGILQRKPHLPGKNPRARGGKLSEYGKQLKEKQKARFMYGLSEKQFKRLYDEASGSKGQTGDEFKVLIERRLDNAIYRAGLAMTRIQARQFVGHGLFMVNGVRVTIPSYRVKEGDVVTIRPKSAHSPVFQDILSAHQKYSAPNWLKVNAAKLTFEVTSLPTAEDGDNVIDVRSIIEFYSRN